MPGFRTHGLQAVCCFLIALICLWGATEWTASALGFHPSLGAPWTTLFGMPLYAPWSLFVWWLTIGEQAPDVFEAVSWRADILEELQMNCSRRFHFGRELV